MAISNYGAKIEQILVPDRDGRFDDVVLGYDSMAGVIGGSLDGRVCQTLCGPSWQCPLHACRDKLSAGANNGKHCLHGGLKGSRFQVFDAMQRNDASVEMSYVFADGEEGFPGTLTLRLIYSLLETNDLVLEFAQGLGRGCESTSAPQQSVGIGMARESFKLTCLGPDRDLLTGDPYVARRLDGLSAR